MEYLPFLGNLQHTFLRDTEFFLQFNRKYLRVIVLIQLLSELSKSMALSSVKSEDRTRWYVRYHPTTFLLKLLCFFALFKLILCVV